MNSFGSSFDPCSGRFFPFNPFLNEPQRPDGQRRQRRQRGRRHRQQHRHRQQLHQHPDDQPDGFRRPHRPQRQPGQPHQQLHRHRHHQHRCGQRLRQPVDHHGQPVLRPGAHRRRQRQRLPAHDPQPDHRQPDRGARRSRRPVVVTPTVQTGTLARTGFESGLALVATGLVLAGMALLVTARRRLHRRSASPAASRSTEWDTVVSAGKRRSTDLATADRLSRSAFCLQADGGPPRQRAGRRQLCCGAGRSAPTLALG